MSQLEKISFERVDAVMAFLNTLPDIDEFRFFDDGKHWITSEWLSGTFAGRAFASDTPEGAVIDLISYLDKHVEHESMVGSVVADSGWPDLDAVKRYLIAEIYNEDEN